MPQENPSNHRVGKATVCKIVSETSLVIYNALKQPYLKHPSSKEWLGISSGFEDSWNFPHCLRAIDGKHIRIECPKLTGSYYYNYKGFYSIILLVICDSNYCFTLFDLGHYGSNNDSGVLAKSEMGELIETQKIGITQPAKRSMCDCDPLPHFFVGDEIFPLKTWLMRPYPGTLDMEQRISIIDCLELGEPSKMPLAFFSHVGGFFTRLYALKLRMLRTLF